MIKLYKYGQVPNAEIFARVTPTVNVEAIVSDIIANVRARGDAAVLEYNLKFDKADLKDLQVSQEEIDEAFASVEPKFLSILEQAAENIRSFHSRQVRNSFVIAERPGIVLGQKVTPIEKVGVYVPGGTAAYPSTVLMDTIPAKIAGCPMIVMVTPPGNNGKINPVILAAAKIAGVDKIFKVGGAQAVAALAYGTESIPKVDKIVGPGNIFVALAKRAVYGYVSIDSIAGPSEILILADESANPRFVAADLLSQCEHDEMASGILITTSRELAENVVKEADDFVAVSPRKAILEKSLSNYGYILVANSMEDAIEAANDIASEHLEIITKNPFETMTKIKNAGAIFLGEYSSEPLGDYFAGPNHVLPTNGTAKFFSPLSVDDFIKKSSVINFSYDALKAVHEKIEMFAENEGLYAHANSIKVRFEEQ